MTEAAGLAGRWALGWVQTERGGPQVGRARRACGTGGARRRSARGAHEGRPGCTGGTRGARRLGARGAGSKRAACAHLGVLLGQQAVHLVHPACFST